MDIDTKKLDTIFDAMRRYSNGDSWVVIGKAHNLDQATVNKWVREYCDASEYEQLKIDAKNARLTMLGADLKRICSLGRKEAIKRLEESPETLDVKDLCQLEKTYGDRLALHEGKATEKIDHILNVVGLEKIEL